MNFEKEKELFEPAIIEIVEVDSVDVIRTSDTDYDQGGWDM